MKKFFLLLIISSQILSLNLCMASEQVSVKLGSDYLIMSDKCIKNTLLSNPEILTLSPFFTIFNEKNVILIHPLKQGSSDLTVLFDKNYESFKIQVEPKTSKIPNQTIKIGDLEIVLLDSLPQNEDFEIDKPPTIEDK